MRSLRKNELSGLQLSTPGSDSVDTGVWVSSL